MAGFRFKSYFLRGRAPIRIVGGSILLRKGAGGGASSYTSPDDYPKTNWPRTLCPRKPRHGAREVGQIKCGSADWS